MGLEKIRRRMVGTRIDAKPYGQAVQLRGFVPVNTGTWLKTTTSEKTLTVSLSSVVATNAVAALVTLRLQDNAVNSYVEARAKASVSSNPASKLRVCADSSSNVHIAQGIIPINSTRQIMYTIFDAKSTAVQTASFGIAGYYI